MVDSPGLVNSVIATSTSGCIEFQHTSGIVEAFSIYDGAAPNAAQRVWTGILSDAAANNVGVEISHGAASADITAVKIIR